MGWRSRPKSIGSLLDSGDRAGAKALVDTNLAGDPSSLHRRWEQASVYCRVGLVEPGLAAALALRDTAAWPKIVGEVWDFTLWAGRPDIGVRLVEESIDVIEKRDDVNALPFSWQHIARAYLGLAWAAGTPEQAQARLAGHAELRDSGWKLESDRNTIVWGSAATIVETFLPATVAAVQGRFVSCREYTDEYDEFLEALFGLAQLPPREAWERLDRLEAKRTLRPIGPAYRAQVAHRGGDPASASRWLQAWFADPLFPMSLPDLVVTGLLGYFVEVRPQWLAATR